jgi:hypothetical protein
MWCDNVIWSRQRYWHDQKSRISNFLRAIIIKILNKKRLKIIIINPRLALSRNRRYDDHLAVGTTF